jgi:spore germination cell wall hydrolase CwlJ-like protein
MSEDNFRTLEHDVLARTLWGEARGEGRAGMEAVACVILNRVRVAEKKGSYWWGSSIIEVCQKPYQFSCWNKDNPNYRKLLAADEDDAWFIAAEGVASMGLDGNLTDITNGATHYHAAGATPGWAYREKPVAVIGRHIFYRLRI